MSAAAPCTPNLAERLRNVRVGLRQDLEVSRHMFRGEPAYVVRDPVTFQSHSLAAADYQMFVSIDPGRTLGETCAGLVERGVLPADDEGVFYQFIFTLHQLGFLNLPVSDHQALYRRFQARQRARRRSQLFAFLFLRVPLVNPDAFLRRTLPAVRWLYTWPFFVGWLIVLAAAGFVAAANWHELVQPLQGLLATQNLPLMWLTLITLKVFHEFGHAYACKHFGGHVPEMGVYFIAFTPCAYVDATTAWGFPRKRDRLIVSLAGVYVESFIAALAVFVWAASGPSLCRDIAYNVIFLASVVTVLFNINPLMRYDGYYVASDLLEIPNLRQRAREYVLAVLKRVLLGIRNPAPPHGPRLRAVLFTFGAAVSVYRIVVLFAIAVLIATKFLYVGIALACVFVATTVIGAVRRLVSYLWFGSETAGMRIRAVALSAVALLGVPAAIVCVPVPARVVARGLVTAERETVVRARVPGFIEHVHVERGAAVRPGELLLELSALETAGEVLNARAALAASTLRHQAYITQDPAAAQQETQRIVYCQSELSHALAREAELRVAAPHAGRIVDGVHDMDCGRYVRAGEPLATVVSGTWHVRLVLTAEEFSAAQPQIGERVDFRTASGADVTLPATIVRISPVGSRRVEIPALTSLAGGRIVVQPQSGETTQPYFEVVLALEDPGGGSLRHGATGTVLLPARPETLGRQLYRRVIRVVNSLL